MKTRRDFLKAGAAMAATLALAACGGATATAPSSSAPASAASSAKPAASAAASSAAKPAPSGAAQPAGVAKPAASAAVTTPGAIDPTKPVTPKVATLDAELALPDSVLQAAKKEGKLSWATSVDDKPAQITIDVFKKRYGIDVDHQQGSEENRTVRTLTEFKAGRNKLDVVMGVGGFMSEYRAAKALTPLNDLPAYANYDVPFRDGENIWAGVRSQYWSIGYNTDKVKDAELPKTWDELTDPKWKGRIGVGDRPQLWAMHLWKAMGPDKASAFLKAFFANGVQRRKEGLDAAAKLMGGGEYDMYVPSAPYRIEGLFKDKNPVGWWSPNLLPVSFSDMTIMSSAPNPNAAKVFVNWFLSREGQDAYCKADAAAPTHPALRLDKAYLGMFADTLLSRQWIAEDPADESTILPDVKKLWQQLWIGG
jgi:iron(III) transport system substrate-binding protein